MPRGKSAALWEGCAWLGGEPRAIRASVRPPSTRDRNTLALRVSLNHGIEAVTGHSLYRAMTERSLVSDLYQYKSKLRMHGAVRIRQYHIMRP